MRACLALFCLAATALFGQTDEGFPDLIPEQRGGVTNPATIEGALQLHGYALTKESLLRGLRDANAQVRSMAAGQLAKQAVGEAVPSILEALSSEKAIGTRVWMANALVKLGVQSGTADLRGVCESTTASNFPRLVAAADLLEAGDAACRDQVIDMVRAMSSLGDGAREDTLHGRPFGDRTIRAYVSAEGGRGQGSGHHPAARQQARGTNGGRQHVRHVWRRHIARGAARGRSGRDERHRPRPHARQYQNPTRQSTSARQKQGAVTVHISGHDVPIGA
ncbi:MAG: hypothetical protein ABSD20_17885 [Terriglobales bacterium]